MIVRPTARLVVLNPDEEVLLFKTEDLSVIDPGDPRGEDQPRCFWVTPGGGVEEDETFEDAALRELWEETGLTADLGPCVLRRDKLLQQYDQTILFREQYFLVHTDAREISLEHQNQAERTVYRDHRWWSLVELETTEDTVFPEELPWTVRSLSLP